MLSLQSCLLDFPVKQQHYIAADIRVNLDVVYDRRPARGGAPTSTFEARFFDKDDKRITFGTNRVFLNGKVMYLAGGNYYERSSNDDYSPSYFRYDSLYTFRILLDSMGPAYICSVRAQRNPMVSYSVQVVGDSAEISWEGDKTLDIRLNYVLERTVNTSSVESVSRSRMFPPPHTGRVRVSMEGYPEFKLRRLETVVSGQVDRAFRSGSIESMVRLSP